jgi:hypothetical protein
MEEELIHAPEIEIRRVTAANLRADQAADDFRPILRGTAIVFTSLSLDLGGFVRSSGLGRLHGRWMKRLTCAPRRSRHRQGDRAPIGQDAQGQGR